MRTLVAGTTRIRNRLQLDPVLNDLPWKPTLVLSAGLIGVARQAECWAAEHRLPFKRFEIEKSITNRNQSLPRLYAQILDEAEAVVLLWSGGDEIGLQWLADEASKRGLPLVNSVQKISLRLRGT